MKKNLVLFALGILILATFVSAGLFGGKAIDSAQPITSNQFVLFNEVPLNVAISGHEFTIEALSISDTSATIKVGDAAKEINEGSSKRVGDLIVKVVTADERFWRSRAVVQLTYSGFEEGNLEEVDETYILSNEVNSMNYESDSGADYLIELMSASDTSATFTVWNDIGSAQTKEINEGSSKIISNLEIALITADETNLALSVTFTIPRDDVVEETEEEVTYQGVLEMFNSCTMMEMQNSDAEELDSLSCDAFCATTDKTCIKQDYGYYVGSIDQWVFDTGGDCDLAYGSINNVNEDQGSKLHCMCC